MSKYHSSKPKVSQTSQNLVKQKKYTLFYRFFFFFAIKKRKIQNYLGNIFIYEEKAIFHLKMYTNKISNSFSIVATRLLHCEGKFFEIGHKI